MVDHWDYPIDGKGDCKVYALYKRKLLIEQGFPRQALLMTIVRDLDGEGHAILTVKTDRGEFVLDNLTDEIRPWDATGYRYVKRQSQDDPNVWLDLGGAQGVSAATAGSARTAAEQPSPSCAGRSRLVQGEAHGGVARRSGIHDEANDGRPLADRRSRGGGVHLLAAVPGIEGPLARRRRGRAARHFAAPLAVRGRLDGDGLCGARLVRSDRARCISDGG